MDILRKLVDYVVSAVCLVIVIMEELTGFRLFERDSDKASK